MATISQVQEVIYRLKLEDQASEAMKAAVEAMKNLNKEFDLNEQVVQKAGKGANTLINQNDAISKTAKTLTGLLRDLSSAQKALAADAATGGEKQAALTRTIENLTTKVQSATQAHNDAVKGVKASGDAAKSSGDAHDDAAKKIGLFGLSAQKTGFLVHDATKAVESLTLGMSPLQVAMQHVGQVQGIFGSLGEAAKAVALSFVSVPGVMIATGAALAGFGVIAESESRRMGDLRQQLRATHDDYASLATTVDAASKQIAASTSLSISQARAAAQTIGAAKLFSGTQADVVELTKTSQDLARVWNTDVATSAKFIADALNDPAKAAKDLAEKGFPGMSLELAHSISLMQTAGQSGQAFASVMGVISKGTAGAVNDQSALSAALKGLEERLYGARDGGKSLASTVGTLVDEFVALQVRGLDKLIEGLDRFIQKVKEARNANGAGAGATAAGSVLGVGGGVDEFQFGGKLPVPDTSSPATGALARVDSSIRGLVEAEAKRYQVDTELLARLQLSEGVLRSDGTWKPSGTGPVGPMQVAPSTFRGMPAFAGQDVNDVPTNIKAGTSLFADLLQKYKDPYLAVLAYHDGETKIDHVLNGDRNPQTGASYQASIDARMQAEKVAGSYTGPGRVFAPGPTIGAGGFDQLSAGNGNLSSAVRTNNLATSQNAFSIAQGINPLSEQIAKSNAEIAGLQAGLDLATKNGETEKIKLLSDALAAAKGKATDLITEQQKMARAAADAVNPLNAEAGATRDLAVIQQKYVEAARRSGTDIDVTSMLSEQTSHLRTLAVAFDDVVKATDRQTEANARIAASVDQTAPSLIAATNREKALEEARKDFLPGPDRVAAVDRYTEALNRQSAASADLATAQKSFDQRDQLQLIQAETASLGENADQRTKELAILKEKQLLLRSGADLQSEISQADLANVARIADANAALNQQKGILAELSGFFENTFNTIANAITSAFATGNLAALKFKDIAKSVVSAVVSEFVKLSLLNPLKNWMEGGTNPTLFSVLGKLFGDSAGGGTSLGSSSSNITESAASALFSGAGATLNADGSTSGGTFGAGAGGVGVVGSLGSINTVGSLLEKIVGTGSGEGVIASLGDKIVTGITNAFGNTTTATEIAATVGNVPGEIGSIEGVSSLARLAAGISDAVGASTETSIAIAGAASTVAEAIPYIGAAISVGTSLIRGDFRGAAFTAAGALAGAAIGSIFFGGPGIGTAIGAAVGSLVGTLFPAHPLHPFDASNVDVQGGRLTQGKTVNQATEAQAGSIVGQFATSINTFLDKAGLILTNLDGTIGAVGKGIQGYETVDNPEKLLSRLQFANNPSDTSNFGIAKGALVGMQFNTGGELQQELLKIAGFADAVDALGIQLKSVAKDISAIQISGVSGGNADALAQVTDAAGNVVSYHNDLRTALNSGLQGQSFADPSALDAKINEINQFVNGTLPQMLTPIEATTSSLIEQVSKVAASYDDAIQKSLQFGLDNTAVLQNAEQQAIAIIRRVALEAISAAQTNIKDRFEVASYGDAHSRGMQTLDNLDLAQQQEREAFSKSITDVYGDIAKTWEGYAVQMAALERTLGAERLAVAKQVSRQIADADRGISDTDRGLWARIYAASGNQKDADLTNFDIKADQERTAFSDQMIAAYGDAIQQSQGYADNMALLERTLGAERLAIQQKYADQSVAVATQTDQSLTTAAQNVTSLLGGLKDYTRSLQVGANSSLSPLSQYDLASRQFNAVAGAATAGDYNSATQLRSYAEALDAASKAVYGSGAQHAEDQTRIINAISGVSDATDALTLSAQKQLVADQIAAQQKTTDAVIDLKAEIAALRREQQQQIRAAA